LVKVLLVCDEEASMTNVWSDEWDSVSDDDWDRGVASTRLPRGDLLGATLYELPPGFKGIYHFHHGSEELLVVLRGRPTLRTPEGERELAEGDVVHFPFGPDGAHAVANRSDAPVRYLMAGTRQYPPYEIVEYPEVGKVTAQAKAQSHRGEPLFLIHDLGASGNELDD
jgi:uncharacterized cupin superfamily protein